MCISLINCICLQFGDRSFRPRRPFVGRPQDTAAPECSQRSGAISSNWQQYEVKHLAALTIVTNKRCYNVLLYIMHVASASSSSSSLSWSSSSAAAAATTQFLPQPPSPPPPPQRQKLLGRDMRVRVISAIVLQVLCLISLNRYLKQMLRTVNVREETTSTLAKIR